jgi:Tfp pilus assembly protein PilX
MKIIQFNNECSVQSGAALITSLIFLTILTILGMSTLGTAMLESRMAGNSRDKNLAFQAAEAALRDAEQYIENSGRISGLTDISGDGTGYGEEDDTTGAPAKTCQHGLCDRVPGVENVCDESTGSGSIKDSANAGLWANAIQYYREDAIGKPIGSAGQVSLPGSYVMPENGIPFVQRQPEYLIEAFPKGCDYYSGVAEPYYRITVKGYGRYSGTLVHVQEVYKPGD